ncbi:hypothetical protein CONCODRAFT_72594 [Conidiobolus coronatus NRRL 28638]|uniref:Uncharacterized protein n=1 Tax=Conidiobolus coronatus (strain ATCC 28846 / CBS 209.66 / NRRL 28638) TaxID=796925 RepID=A0A137NZ88_CONC2|nr:hypothetical protein CONCODRAFT_72594 [Conidiobolus coronatus NRRL 28638]|eukprot:KXN67961.1 hypothetical protein CONCODRAFT_72594 [Conidiobolus coronatus NRRL 28638]
MKLAYLSALVLGLAAKKQCKPRPVSNTVHGQIIEDQYLITFNKDKLKDNIELIKEIIKGTNGGNNVVNPQNNNNNSGNNTIIDNNNNQKNATNIIDNNNQKNATTIVDNQILHQFEDVVGGISVKLDKETIEKSYQNRR